MKLFIPLQVKSWQTGVDSCIDGTHSIDTTF